MPKSVISKTKYAVGTDLQTYSFLFVFFLKYQVEFGWFVLIQVKHHVHHLHPCPQS